MAKKVFLNREIAIPILKRPL